MEEKESFIEHFIFDQKYWALRHGAFWLVMYMPELVSLFFGTDMDWVLEDLIGVVIDIVLVYFHLYFLVPKFLMKGSYLKFFMISLGSLIIGLGLNYIPYDFDCEECDTLYSIMITFILTLTLVATAIAAKIFKISFKNSRQINELRQLNLQSDLKNLQDQINPHFLFNALNSIYVQAKKGSDNVAESVMQLSELMRYQTYDSQKETVKLKDEIEYYRNYLNVEKERRDNMKIGFIVKGESANIFVAPLIFLPLVENAVKYSQRSDGKGSTINLEFDLTQNEEIGFSIVNNLSNYDVNKGKSSGSGLVNFQKRLDILYPNHKMNVSQLDDKYFATLVLPTQPAQINF